MRVFTAAICAVRSRRTASRRRTPSTSRRAHSTILQTASGTPVCGQQRGDHVEIHHDSILLHRGGVVRPRQRFYPTILFRHSFERGGITQVDTSSKSLSMATGPTGTGASDRPLGPRAGQRNALRPSIDSLPPAP